VAAQKTFDEHFAEITQNGCGFFTVADINIIKLWCLSCHLHGRQVGGNEGIAWERARAAKEAEEYLQNSNQQIKVAMPVDDETRPSPTPEPMQSQAKNLVNGC